MKAFKSLFVRNNGAASNADVALKAQPIQNLTTNLIPKLVRHDTMEGRDYLVVPMVILTEGVHKGSEGPLYYPPEELGKTPVVWNHKPVVVYHPEINGNGVSACDPGILTNRKVGLMMNTQWDKKTGRLKSEAWIDKDRADKVDPRIMEAIERNTTMELSTGVFVDSEANPGNWKQEEYVGVARNYRPDHLAILPDKIGACSIADGAGFLRNQGDLTINGDFLVTGKEGEHLPVKKDGKPDHRLMGAAWAALHGGYRGNKYEGPNKNQAIEKLKALYKSEKMDLPTENVEQQEPTPKGITSLLIKMAKKLGLTTNDIPFDSIRQQLYDLIKDECGCEQDYYQGPYPYVADVYSNFFVYEYDGTLWQRGYTLTDDGVALDDGDPVEVERVPPQYKPVAPVNAERKETNMNKEQIVNQLIANSNGLFAEADRPRLMALNDNQLKRITFAKEETTAAAPAAAAQPVANAAAQPTVVEKKPVTVAEYINNAPKEVQEVLNAGLSSYNDEKNLIVANLLALKDSGFTQDELSGKPLGELRKMAKMVGLAAASGKSTATPESRILNFSGMAPVAQNAEVNTQEVLRIPSMAFNAADDNMEEDDEDDKAAADAKKKKKKAA